MVMLKAFIITKCTMFTPYIKGVSHAVCIYHNNNVTVCNCLLQNCRCLITMNQILSKSHNVLSVTLMYLLTGVAVMKMSMLYIIDVVVYKLDLLGMRQKPSMLIRVGVFYCQLYQSCLKYSIDKCIKTRKT